MGVLNDQGFPRFVERAGPEGISQQDLGRKLGHGKLEARTICRCADKTFLLLLK